MHIHTCTLTSQTDFMRRKVEKEAWDTQLGVWGRGVDPDLFSPARRCQDLRRQLGVGPDDIAVLWLGRVVQEKQPGVWLRVRYVRAYVVKHHHHFLLLGVCVCPQKRRCFFPVTLDLGLICHGYIRWRKSSAPLKLATHASWQ